MAAATKARLIGDPHVVIASVASFQRATAHDLVFCEEERFLPDAFATPAAAVVAGEFAASEAEPPKPLLIAKQPRLAFAVAAKHLRTVRKMGGIVHPTAIVPPTAVFGQNVIVGAYVVMGEHVILGDGTAIGAGTCIGSHVVIGSDCEIYSRVTIYHGTVVGSRTVVHSGAVLGSDGFGYVRDAETGRYHQMPQIGRLMIGDDVEIGANVTIDRGGLEDTVIGAGTKIDNLVHIGHNVKVGENVIMAAQAGISGSVTIGPGALLGGQVGIGDHAHLEAGVMLGGQSGVLSGKVFRAQGPCFGTPARPLQEFLKEQAVLSRIARKPE